MIPSPSHPWSPWRPLAALGWLSVVACFLVGACLLAEYARWDTHRRAQCTIRWTTTKTAADSVRVAGDCGLSVTAPQTGKTP